jgi:hypothetical protein
MKSPEGVILFSQRRSDRTLPEDAAPSHRVLSSGDVKFVCHHKKWLMADNSICATPPLWEQASGKNHISDGGYSDEPR